MIDKLTDRDVQVNRWKWVLRLAGDRARVSGWGPAVISSLAPALVDSLAEEGYVICKQSDWDLISTRLEERR